MSFISNFSHYHQERRNNNIFVLLRGLNPQKTRAVINIDQSVDVEVLLLKDKTLSELLNRFSCYFFLSLNELDVLSR
jgi:hypothetical protein